MPVSFWAMTPFETATAIVPAGAGTFEAAFDEAWWGAGGPHGGYFAAIMLRALTAAANDATRAPRSFSVHFVDRPVKGPATITASIDRTGRSVTYVSARLEQDGRPCATALAAFSVPYDAVAYDDAERPALPGPDTAFRIPSDGDGIPPFLRFLDSRAAVLTMPFSGAERAETASWMRLREPSTIDAVTLAFFADACLPSAFVRADRPIGTPTVDLSIHFCRALPAGADGFVLGRFGSILAHDGFVVEDGELWSEDGLLLARSRQHMLTLPLR